MLSFDPHRWLAEADAVADVAVVAAVGAPFENAQARQTAATVATLATDPCRELRTWHHHLSRLDEYSAPTSISGSTWFQLCLDAWWLYETHASYAVRHGWGADSLFGVRLGYPIGGGLAQVLRSSRHLLWDGPVATYRLFGVTSQRSAEMGAGLPPIWGLP